MRHNNHWLGLLCCLVLLADSHQELQCDETANDLASKEVADSYYTAGVVEFRPAVPNVGHPLTSQDMLNEQLAAYIEIINSAEAIDTDIIVFPEGTLNSALQATRVPAPHEAVILCNSTQQHDNLTQSFLVQLSCAARQARKYLVINLTEQEVCNNSNTATMPDLRPCAPNGLNLYNTNVVFDRVGRIISRYRKWHVYLEARNTTMQPEFAIFETDFGVRFGHFICFDILFYTPAEELVAQHGVRDFIYPNWFYSELPFLTAVQLQQSWSWANDVNLLAAGASYPQQGVTGTGIYAGANGALIAVMTTEGSGIRQLFVAKVPKKQRCCNKANKNASNNNNNNNFHMQQNVRNTKTSPASLLSNYTSVAAAAHAIKLMIDPQIEHFQSMLLDFDIEHHVARHLCYDNFCCYFDIRIALSNASDTSYKFRIGVFKGQRSYEQQEFSNLQICALYACLDERVESCAQIQQKAAILKHNNNNNIGAYKFEALRIQANFVKAETLLLMPNTLDERLYPLSANTVTWTLLDNSSAHYTAELKLSKCVDNLLTFAIYANYYNSTMSAKSDYNKNGDNINTLMQK